MIMKKYLAILLILLIVSSLGCKGKYWDELGLISFCLLDKTGGEIYHAWKKETNDHLVYSDSFVATFGSDHEVSAQGIRTWQGCCSYVGEYKDRLPNGYGVMTWENGCKYEGNWVGGYPNGYGEGITEKGIKYIGEVKDGYAHGIGTAILTDGTEYKGRFKKGQFQGN